MELLGVEDKVWSVDAVLRAVHPHSLEVSLLDSVPSSNRAAGGSRVCDAVQVVKILTIIDILILPQIGSLRPLFLLWFSDEDIANVSDVRG